MNEKYIGKYFDSMIDKAVTNLEEEAYENVDQTTPQRGDDPEKLLRKAKIDCLNMIVIG